MDKLQKHIYDRIVDARGLLNERVVRIIAGKSGLCNIAFLIKYTFGPDIDLSSISIPIIDIRNDHVLKAKQAAVLVHEGVGKFTIIVKVEVKGHEAHKMHVIPALTEKVDAIITEILEKEGSGGYSVQKLYQTHT